MSNMLISILYTLRQTFTKPTKYRALYWSISLCLRVCTQHKDSITLHTHFGRLCEFVVVSCIEITSSQLTLAAAAATTTTTTTSTTTITTAVTANNSKGKGTAVPLQAWSGPEVSRKMRFPDFMTKAQDGGRLSALSTGRLYPPPHRKCSWYSFLLEAESTPGP